MRFLEPLGTLREPLFRRLYIAQGISLLGDSITWVGIALLAYELGGDKSSEILATSLTIRVTAFIIFGSFAGILADRYNRKKIMLITNMTRMIIVFSLAFVNTTWQLYILVFLVNIFNAFFSPAYKATVPQLISDRKNYGNAISLSNSTWQLLGVLGPGLAGVLAAFWGSRQIFFIDSLSFIFSSIILLFIPIGNVVASTKDQGLSLIMVWNDMKTGTRLIFRNKPIRFALMIEFAAALAGAQIFVNTIGHVKGGLGLGDDQYGFIMAAFGIGAAIAAFTSSSIDKSVNKSSILVMGAMLLGLSLVPANYASFHVLVFLWIMAGIGISYADMPSQILIAENIVKEQQGKAYGSHFAFTHVWWATGYAFAGLSGTAFRDVDFLTGGLLSLIILGILTFIRFKKK